mmetsp:Transcript_10567/g.19477  ORF Transcript_10567/g.19477 Transcript_10567/m.19477 type:complete len:648 (+) Transcript_10567:106-2049(+)
MQDVDDDPLDWEVRMDSVPFWRHACAGSLAGITEHVGMYPLDTVKTRMQVSNLPTAGVVQTMRAIIAERGFYGLFRGASVIGAGCVPAHCAMFTTYEFGKQKLLQNETRHQPVLAATCGAAASTAHDLILTPTDVVKQRLQLGCYNGPWHCVRETIRAEGFSALFRSLPVTLLSNGPHVAVLASVNESMKLFLGLDRGSSSVDLPWYFLCAGVGGMVAAGITLPLDVLKTRIQTQGAMTLQGSPPARQSVLEVARGIFQEHGMRGFYKGLVPRLIVATPSAAMCWGTYESMQSFLCYILDEDADVDNPSVAAQIALKKAANAADLAASKVGIGSEFDSDDPLEWEHWDPWKVPLWKHCVAGSAAGVMEHVAMYPVDTVKTQMQAVPVEPGQPPLSVRGAMRGILAENGIYGFFRGCTAIGVACIPAHIGLFGTYELTKLWLLKQGVEKEHAPLKAACCGALSTVVHDSIIVPMDVVKQRLQLGCYDNPLDCILRTLRGEGITAFYRSLPSTLIMECPFYAVLVASNESLKLALSMEGPARRADRQSMVWHFTSAGISGIVASAVTQPLDVVKTRLQTQEVWRDMARDGQVVSEARYRGLLGTFVSVLSEEGVRGLYRGTIPRMVFAAPSAAMCWGTYEAVKNMLSYV